MIIQQLWQNFASQVLPKDVGRNQYEEMRLAFFAGASSMLNAMSEIPCGDEEVDQFNATMEQIHGEIAADVQYQIDRLTHASVTSSTARH